MSGYLLPEIQLDVEGVLGRFQIAGEIVPSVIAVDAYDVHRPGDQILGVVVLTADHRHRAVLGVELMRQNVQRFPVVVCGLWEVLGVRFVAEAPHGN